MFIELRGVEFVNKGAELMLHAILQEIGRELPKAKFVMKATGRSPIAKLRKNNIYIKSDLKRNNLNLEPYLKFVPNFILNAAGIASKSQINVVLDGSGFAFGDKWGAKKAGFRMADHIIKWKNENKKVILLPQAFGPFTKEDIILKMKIILENADLVFARDKVSYDYLNKIKSKDNVFLFPDFTNLIKGDVPSYFNRESHQIGIIPNQKMMETDNEDENNKYLDFLKSVVQIFQSKNEKPFFLIHESNLDFKIAKQVNEMLDEPIEIIEEDNPIAVKGIIGACKAVVTSRFHGLVSALSQSIPCLATGWSHKYEMLFRDYNYEEGLCSVNDTNKVLDSKIHMLLETNSREGIIQKLSLNAKEQKSLTKQMWNKAYQVIK